MITLHAGKVAFGCILLLVAGCSREQQDWRSAEAADTVEGYGQFIERHPDSELASQARLRVTQLAEERDWQRASSIDTTEGYRQFMVQHPTAKMAQEARVRIESFALGAQPAGTPAAVDSPGVPPAVPAAINPEPPMLAPLPAQTQAPVDRDGKPGFAVQLGAFQSAAGAQNAWSTLTARFSPQLGALTEQLVPAQTESGQVYRLQALVANEASARALCTQLRGAGQGCVPVLPP
ncbi:MAG TPA: SPOR domain-containing protein [Steroidobacteraceae bacterium]